MHHIHTMKRMQIVFTQHALARMTERGVSRDEVLATIAHPIRSLNVENDRWEAQGWVERGAKRMTPSSHLRARCGGDRCYGHCHQQV